MGFPQSTGVDCHFLSRVLPNPGIEPKSPALPVDALPLSHMGNPLELVAQIVKNLPAMQETQVRSLGWEDPLEKEMAAHSSILAYSSSNF